MKTDLKKYIRYIVIGIIATGTAVLYPYEKEQNTHPRDYAEIKESGVLRVVTEYNSLSFYVDGDSISGFHYELIEAFAQSQGLKTEVIPVMSFEEQLKRLDVGMSDILAYSISVISELKDSLLFTSPLVLNKQVLVQRKSTGKEDSTYIRSQLDLSHKTLHVVKGSPSILRIRNLSNEIGDTVYIREVERYGDEQLLAMVAHGDIDYAVCQESVAVASLNQLPQLDINTDISFTQFYSWAVSKQSPVLLDSINVFLARFKESKEYERMYKKYYLR